MVRGKSPYQKRGSTYLARVDTTRLPSLIAFGSCSHQDKAQPILDVVLEHEPDLFIYLGDNIYGDSRELDTLAAKYGRLGPSLNSSG